ncbi:Bin3-domain-containing protein [Patellaria atrata CBS 101060]|uniref:RNA methyltransferase n=1 Tax=Patellaria atrata CBS 101060 TaxID=1346257 RepID=A0A9P4VPI5_9PEZI|nr:Bin3-domain-containing protein [Patellaria atrata CBS 101060]
MMIGNYQYYQGSNRHQPGPSANASHIRDKRLELIASLIPGFFDNKEILDLGCNAGNVAVWLGLAFNAKSVTGVDIDQNLISKARSHRSFQISRIRPSRALHEADLIYFPISAIIEHGHRETRENPAIDCHGFRLIKVSESRLADASLPALPKIEFVCEDWAVSENPRTSGPYDVILALSVVKWIHLEHQDDGLQVLFAKFSKCLSQNGFLVLEIQPWDSYQKAVKRGKSPHLHQNFDRLQIHPDQFADLLVHHGFKQILTSKDLPREIQVYRKMSK